MNAASRSVVPPKRPKRRPNLHSKGTPSPAGPFSTAPAMPSRTSGQKVEKLNPSSQSMPSWLRSLIFLQRSSDLLALFLCATTLALYSWTVYTQQQWTQAYRELEALRRNERQLTTANAVIKDQLAQQAERPATGLVNPSRDNTILLPPAPQRQFMTPGSQTPEKEPMANTPLGY